MGMRNGIIDRWDWREASGKTDTIVNMSDAHDGDRGLVAGKGAASVDHLRIVHGHELLVRTMRGDVRIHRVICAHRILLLTWPLSPAGDARFAVLEGPGTASAIEGTRSEL